MQRHFRVSSPSVHQMVVTLERNGFIHSVRFTRSSAKEALEMMILFRNAGLTTEVTDSNGNRLTKEHLQALSTSER